MSQSKKATIRQKLATARQHLLDTVQDLDDAGWTTPIYAHGDEPWSAADLLRHLSWAESGMLRGMQHIRQGGGGVPDDFDLDRYNAAGVRKQKEMTPTAILAQMEQNRQELLAFLDDLQADDWDKQGRHGSGRIMTIEQILHQIADHERQHTEDLRRALTPS